MADLSSLLGSAGIGGAIGKAIVSLELETTKYQAELKAAQAQTVTSTNSMGGTLSKFGSIGSTAFLAVGAAAVAGLAYSVNAAVEADAALLKLQNTFENNANLSDSSVEAFQRQAEALQLLTGESDEAIITAQALLGAFDVTGEEVQKLTPLIVDLSAKYGVDMEAAAKAVGKAIEGNTGSLARYGITLDDAALEADSFSAVLEGLGKNAGFAEERADAEPWRVLGAQFDELAEKVGKSILPILIKLADALVDVVSGLTPLFDLIGKAAPAVELLGKAFGLMVSPVLTLVRGFNALAEALDLGLEPTDEMIALMGSAVIQVESMKQTADLAAAGIYNLSGGMTELGDATDKAGKDVARFANMSKKELEEFQTAAEESFDSVVFDLDNMAHRADVTRREFIRAHEAMEDRATELADAMKEISKQNWVNEEYIAFLSEQGPEWLIGFTKLTKEQQREAQQAWKESTKETDNAKTSFDNILEALGKIGGGTSKHIVKVHYEYVGFDPSKPGMTTTQRTGFRDVP